MIFDDLWYEIFINDLINKWEVNSNSWNLKFIKILNFTDDSSQPQLLTFTSLMFPEILSPVTLESKIVETEQ